MISVIIPVHNGERNIAETILYTVEYFVSRKDSFEIIVVDDCSSDDTFIELENLKQSVHIKIIRKVVWQGKGAALKTGVKNAQGDYILFMDGDLQIVPDELDTFFKIMELYNASVVIGNKRHSYSNTQYSLARWIVSNGYYFITRVLFGIPLRDTQCGFKLFKTSVIKNVINKLLVKQFAFDLELIVALKEANVRIADAPVYVSQPMGTGSVTFYNIINTLKDTLAVWHRKNMGWYK